jgi:DNA-binding CsgD family transcriptional regulator
MSKPRQKASKTKLKTMSQISAAEAQRLFHAVMGRGDHALTFPKYIPAKEFLECYKLHVEVECLKLNAEALSAGIISKRSRASTLEELEVGSAQAKGDVSEVSKTLTEKELQSYKLSRREWQIIGLFRENRSIRDKEIATILNINKVRTVSSHLANLFRKFGVNNRTELAAKLPPLPPSNTPKP